jgi:hypothetical protein
VSGKERLDASDATFAVIGRETFEALEFVEGPIRSPGGVRGRGRR